MTTLFEEVHPRTPQRDEALEGLGTRLWPICLAQLYLSTGRYCPQEAKQLGATFGFCDEDGRLKPKAEATHVGWTVEAARR